MPSNLDQFNPVMGCVRKCPGGMRSNTPSRTFHASPPTVALYRLAVSTGSLHPLVTHANPQP